MEIDNTFLDRVRAVWQHTRPMSYGLSFSDRFFYSEQPEQTQCSERPTSVYQAVLSMREEAWQQVARDVFHADSQRLDLDTVMDRVCQTDTCSDLSSPVDVWIDPEGLHTVAVYDKQHDA